VTEEQPPAKESEQQDTDEHLAEEEPEQRPSRQREHDISTDSYTSGYDALGETRVGIGSAGGDATKLIRHNEGRHCSDGDHSIREASRDKARVTEAFCSALEISSYRQQRAISAMLSMNLDRFGRQKRLEKVALTTIKYVVERDRHSRIADENIADLSDDEIPDRLTEDDDFLELLEEQNVSRSDLYSTSQIVKRELGDDSDPDTD
jgi:hypothetical protein